MIIMLINLPSNCFAGGIDAAMAFPGSNKWLEGDETGLRWLTIIMYALATLIFIAMNMEKMLNVLLGLVSLAMVGLFSIIVHMMVQDGKVDGDK